MSRNRSANRRTMVPAITGGPIHLRIIQESASGALAEIGIDYSRAAVPERAYYADHCDVKRSRSGVTLLFGKLIPETTQLRTQVEIVYPDDMFLKQFWATTREMHKLLLDQPEQRRLAPIDSVHATDKVQSFRANIVFIGTWGDEAVADFYYLSPRDMHYLRTGTGKLKAELEPVLRVAMYPGLLLELFEKAKDIAHSLESVVQEVLAI